MPRRRDRVIELNPEFTYQDRVAHAARIVMQFYRHYSLQANESTKPEWAYMEQKQSFRDSLEAMCRAGVIDDYDLSKYTITIGDKVIHAVLADNKETP